MENERAITVSASAYIYVPEVQIKVEHNRHDSSTLHLTIDEARTLRDALDSYLREVAA